MANDFRMVGSSTARPMTWSVSDDVRRDAKQRIARYNETSPLTYLRNCPLV